MRRPFHASPDHDDAEHSREAERAAGFLAGIGSGLHPATREASLTIGSNERCLILGPQTTPLGVVLRIEGVMRTL